MMVMLGLLECVGLLLAHSPSHLIDGFFPHLPDGADGPLAWLHVGKVPILILLILFLAGFTATGYAIQGTLHAWSGTTLPVWLAASGACLTGFVTVAWAGGWLATIIPQDETSAVCDQSLVGRTAVIILGTARYGFAAQAKVRDAYGRAHYVMVEPHSPEDLFNEGTEVLLLSKQGVNYRCICPALSQVSQNISTR